MNSFIAIPITLLFGLTLVLALRTRLSGREWQIAFACFVVHTLGALAQVGITSYFYGGGDMLQFHKIGQLLAEWVTYDPANNLPLLIDLILQRDVLLPIDVVGIGSSTGSIFGVAGLLGLIFGSSLVSVCFFMGYCSMASQFAIFMAMRDRLAPRLHLRVFAGIALLPSTVFWTSGLLKESFALGGLGLMFLGAKKFVEDKGRLSGLTLLALGVIPVAIMKSYILFPFAISASIWFYWHSTVTSKKRLLLLTQPLYLVLGLLLAVGSLFLLGRYFPRFALENMNQELSKIQMMYQQGTQGGSSYAIAVPTSQQGFAGQLSLLPIGLISALFRPFIFEVHNAMALLNAAETTFILGSVIWIGFKRGVRKTVGLILSSPLAMFCLTFTLLFSVIVGLSTPNLGSLSRYRAPMMPFYISLILMLLPRRR